jgi:crotonobetainyl-CoA:carnitine CoA-transferase CaiB-like acyl-CoA transferase
MSTNKGALTGIKVIELCQMVAGPFCTKLLADLGADVIKIEEPRLGDEARRKGPFLNNITDPERSGLFAYLNTNKLGITLNIEISAGKDILKELIREPETILIEDKPPKLMSELGLSYENMKRINRQLIMTSITPFGQTGPYKNFKAYPLNIIHGGGEGYTIPGGTEYLDRPPIKPGRFVGEYDAGLSAAVATLGALYWRGISGLGQHIDISKQETVMSVYFVDMPRYANEGVTISRANQGYSFGGIMECKDGYVAIVCWTERDWQALMDFVGNPDWAEEERFKDDTARRLHGDEVQSRLLEFTVKYTKDELYHQGQAVRCPIAKVFTIKDLFQCKQLEEREFFAEVEHPNMGKVRYPTAPYKFSETSWEARHPAPLLGQHNEEIYCQRLGYTKEKFVKLRQAGII